MFENQELALRIMSNVVQKTDTKFWTEDTPNLINTVNQHKDNNQWEELFKLFSDSLPTYTSTNIEKAMDFVIRSDFHKKLEREEKDVFKSLILAESIICSDNCPEKIAEKTYNVFYETYGHFPLFFNKMLNRDLSDSMIEFLADIGEKRFLSNAQFYYSNDKGFNQQNVNKIYKYLAENGIFSLRNKFDTIQYIKNPEIIEDILKSSDYDENAVTMVLNSSYVSDKRKDELFDMDRYVPYRISKFTPHMTDVFCEQIWTTLFDLGYREDRKNKTATSDEIKSDMLSTSLLEKLIITGVLPESRQIDLANRLVSENSSSKQELESLLISYTEYPQVLDICAKLKNRNKECVYTNQYCSDKLLIDRAKECQKKIETSIKRKQIVSNKHINDIKKTFKCKNLPIDIYHTMLKTPKTLSSILYEKEIPDSILELIKNKNYTIDEKEYSTSSKHALVAYCMLSLRKTDIDYNMAQRMCHMLDNLTYIYYSDIVEHNDALEQFVKILNNAKNEPNYDKDMDALISSFKKGFQAKRNQIYEDMHNNEQEKNTKLYKLDVIRTDLRHQFLRSRNSPYQRTKFLLDNTEKIIENYENIRQAIKEKNEHRL